jgi:hypothetical protein
MAASSLAPQLSISDPVQHFGELVWNRGKSDSAAPLPPRERGFVCVVRRAQGLEPLQAACQQIEPGLFCATLRYGVQSTAAMGTAIHAALRDLAAIHAEPGVELLGRVLPDPADPRWKPPLDSGLGRLVRGWEMDKHGFLDADRIEYFIGVLESTEVLSEGMRLVLFVEVEGSDGDPGAVEAWRRAAELLFHRLPERVGLVLSGAPQGFVLPEDPVHFLEIPEVGDDLDTGTDASAGAQTAAHFLPAELVADVPTSHDHLDRNTYASSLAAFLLHGETAPPITIGLYGRWGTGKSSFWNLLQRLMVMEVARDVAKSLSPARIRSMLLRRRFFPGKNPVFTEVAVYLPSRQRPNQRRETLTFTMREAERLAEQRIITLAFNAWQYDDAKQTWAGLASTISARLEKALPFWRRQWMRLKYAWHTNRSDVLLNFGLPVLLLVLAAVVLLPWLAPSQVRELAPEGKANENPLGGLLKAVLPAGSLLLLLWGVGWRLVEVLKPVSERVAGYLRRTDYRADMGYQHKVIDDLKFLLAELEAARKGTRVLVYIDDLDRCSDEKIIEILRATILILADCKLFVMFGMDTEMIRRAITAHYEKMKVPLADPQSFAENYLRKIVQIALYLPETLPERRFSLVESMFSDPARQAYRRRATAPPAENQPGDSRAAVVSEGLPYDLSTLRRAVKVEPVEDTADELAALAELQVYLPDNARELKRFVNMHRFLKILLSASGASWSGRKQQALVKWLLFCVNWPARVNDVLFFAREHPEARDCLKPACVAGGWDEELGDFTDLGVPISATELLSDFDLAARLSQAMHDVPRPTPGEKTKVQLPGPVVRADEGTGTAAPV